MVDAAEDIRERGGLKNAMEFVLRRGEKASDGATLAGANCRIQQTPFRRAAGTLACVAHLGERDLARVKHKTDAARASALGLDETRARKAAEHLCEVVGRKAAGLRDVRGGHESAVFFRQREHRVEGH